MELSAVLNAVRDIATPLRIVSDSAYVVNCFEQRWWVKWRSNRWRNSKGDLVANQDLWEALITQVVDDRPGEITFRWVKGHAGEPLNELADMLANRAAREQLNAR